MQIGKFQELRHFLNSTFTSLANDLCIVMDFEYLIAYKIDQNQCKKLH